MLRKGRFDKDGVTCRNRSSGAGDITLIICCFTRQNHTTTVLRWHLENNSAALLKKDVEKRAYILKGEVEHKSSLRDAARLSTYPLFPLSWRALGLGVYQRAFCLEKWPLKVNNSASQGGAKELQRMGAKPAKAPTGVLQDGS